MPRRQLPRQVVRVLDSGVHAEPAGGGKHVRSVAGEEDVPAREFVRHHRTHAPRADAFD